MFTITLGHLVERGVSFQRYEALAIAQELIARGEGVPTANNVQLSSDGSVTCINTNGTPAVADVAGLLQTLLPQTPAQMPAPLRYTLARGLSAVEAPPFESLAAFSESLARFEAGDRRGIIRSLLQRVAGSAPAAVIAAPAAGAVRAVAPPAAVVSAATAAVAAPAAVVSPAPAATVATSPAVASLAPVAAVAALPAVASPAPVAAVAAPLAVVAPVAAPPAMVAPAPVAAVAAPPAVASPAPVAAVATPPAVVAPAPVAAVATPPAVVAPAPVAAVAAPPAVVAPARVAAVAAPAAVVASAAAAPPPAAIVARPSAPALTAAPVPAGAPRPLDGRAASPSRARSAEAPLNWKVALVAVAASFVIGVLGSHWAGLWQQPAASDARPPATHVSAGSPAETVAPRSRVAERPVSTTGSTPVPHTDVALVPAPRTQESAARQDVPISAPLPAGTPVPMIRGDSESAFSPAFVNTGSAMFFHTGGAGDRSSAIAMTPDAASWPAGDLRIVKVLDDGARNYHPRPSPDGRMIAFDSDRDGERGIYVANGDGTQVRRVSGDGYAAAPTWSPDGKRLAYIRAESGNSRVWNLWVQALGGERATRVTGHQFGQTWSASWFPDNQRICYTHEDKIIVRNLSTGESRQFASPVAGRIVRTPAVSPDGTKVVFQVFRNGGWLLDLADGSMRHVLSDPTAEEFAWAPDGNRIAFHSRRTGEWSIYVVAPG